MYICSNGNHKFYVECSQSLNIQVNQKIMYSGFCILCLFLGFQACHTSISCFACSHGHTYWTDILGMDRSSQHTYHSGSHTSQDQWLCGFLFHCKLWRASCKCYFLLAVHKSFFLTFFFPGYSFQGQNSLKTSFFVHLSKTNIQQINVHTTQKSPSSKIGRAHV